MTPRPYRAPDTTRRDHTDRREVAEEPDAAARVVRPKINADGERHGEQEAQENTQRTRRALLLEVLRFLGGCLRSLGSSAFLRRKQGFIGDRFELPIDLRHLF